MSPPASSTHPVLAAHTNASLRSWDAAYAAREAAYAAGPHPKELVAPLVLFTIPRGGGSLSPVALQLFPDGHGGARYPVFAPRDGTRWLAAKLAVGAADGNVHEAIAHLGTTHLVQEAFMLAMHNCLAPRHPLNRLLAPHFEGTVNINAAADAALVSPNGSVDHLLMPTIGSMGYVHHYYAEDGDVVADAELQAFVAQVGAYQVEDARGRQVGGGIAGVGEGDRGAVSTRADLVQMITQIIWNGGAQHAAVNFPQAHEMAYAPMCSLALMGPTPTGAGFDDAALLRMLTARELAGEQFAILDLLGSVYHTQLGHYPSKPGRGCFGRGPVHELELALRVRLANVERTIDARNLERPSYRYLRPSEIPQSINI